MSYISIPPFEVVCIDASNDWPLGSPTWGYLNLLKEGETYTVEIVNSLGGYKLAGIDYNSEIGGTSPLPRNHVPGFEPYRFQRINPYSNSVSHQLAIEALKERVEVDGPVRVLENN